MDFGILAIIFIVHVYLECFIWMLMKKVATPKREILAVEYLKDSISI